MRKIGGKCHSRFIKPKFRGVKKETRNFPGGPEDGTLLRGVVGSAPAQGAGSHVPQLRHGAAKYIFKKRERERDNRPKMESLVLNPHHLSYNI